MNIEEHCDLMVHILMLADVFAALRSVLLCCLDLSWMQPCLLFWHPAHLSSLANPSPSAWQDTRSYNTLHFKQQGQ